MNEKDAALYAAWSAASAELTNPTKDAKADTGSYGYTYATLAAILDHVRPVLARHGLAVFQNVTTAGDLVGVETIITHKDGAWISFGPLSGPKAGSWQNVGSAITYARRYALTAALNIAADEDDDASSADAPRVKVTRDRARSEDPWTHDTPPSDDVASVDVGSRTGPAAKRWATSPASDDQRRFLTDLVTDAGLGTVPEFLQSARAAEILGGKPSSPLVMGHASTLIEALSDDTRTGSGDE
jgi:hypothetical protein